MARKGGVTGWAAATVGDLGPPGGLRWRGTRAPVHPVCARPRRDSRFALGIAPSSIAEVVFMANEGAVTMPRDIDAGVCDVDLNGCRRWLTSG